MSGSFHPQRCRVSAPRIMHGLMIAIPIAIILDAGIALAIWWLA